MGMYETDERRTEEVRIVVNVGVVEIRDRGYDGG